MKPVLKISAIALLLAAAIGADPAWADQDAVAPPDGAQLVLSAAAEGVQIYSCEAKDNGFAWTFKGPEAALFDDSGRQIIHHFAGPSWQAEADGTILVGEVQAKA